MTAGYSAPRLRGSLANKEWSSWTSVAVAELVLRPPGPSQGRPCRAIRVPHGTVKTGAQRTTTESLMPRVSWPVRTNQQERIPRICLPRMRSLVRTGSARHREPLVLGGHERSASANEHRRSESIHRSNLGRRSSPALGSNPTFTRRGAAARCCHTQEKADTCVLADPYG
jgi:hypothetical protein